MNIYPANYLDSYSSAWPPDIALYLGGYDIQNEEAQGMTDGFTNPPDKCRYAWAQMVSDGLFYPATPQAQASVSLHEIGHMFDAHHDDVTRPPGQPQYTHAIDYPDEIIPGLNRQTVMWHYYLEPFNTMEFSSFSSSYCGLTVFCHGDSTHDNARRISETRDTVAMYAHKDKIGVFRPGNGYWYLNYNYSSDAAQKIFHFGKNGDIPVVGDYNGDDFSDAAIFRPSTGYWYFDYNLDEVVDNSFRFGKLNDLPIKGDWQGTGRDGIAIFRPSSGYWYFDYNLDGVVDNSFRYGNNGDQILAGDWQGTGTDGIAIFRPSSGFWYFDYGLDGTVDNYFRFGKTGDQALSGDWSGTGTDGIAIFRPSSGFWYFDYNLDGVVDDNFQFGSNGDVPVIGDWNGGGYSHAGVFRPSNGNWYLSSGEVGTITFHFGSNGDIPNVGWWKRENII